MPQTSGTGFRYPTAESLNLNKSQFIESRSDAPFIAPQIYVKTRAEAVSELFADLGQPKTPGLKHIAIHAFRHENDRFGRHSDFAHNLLDFKKIGLLRDDEFELVRIVRRELTQDIGLVPQTIVLSCPSPSLAQEGRRVCQL